MKHQPIQASGRDFESVRQIIDELVRRAEEKRRWRPDKPTRRQLPPPKLELQMRFDFDAPRIARAGSQRPATGVNESPDEFFERNFPE